MTLLRLAQLDSGLRAVSPLGPSFAAPAGFQPQGKVAMSKSLERLAHALRNVKHPFRQVDDRPDKPKKHRYERRKVREVLRYGDWSEELSS